jgi:hypothetical protein
MEPIKEDSFGKTYEHESFGVMNISRFSSSHDAVFFGSSIRQNHGISLEISHAELHRSDLHYDSYFGKKHIIRVEMSPTQFADAITGLNIGAGTPVTIDWLEGKKMEPPPFESKVEQFQQEFKDVAKKIGQEFDEVIARAMSKKYPQSFIKELDLLRGRVTSNFPFLNRQFNEQMEKTVKEAKGAVDAFVTSSIQHYGLEALKNQAPKLQEAEDIKVIEMKVKQDAKEK